MAATRIVENGTQTGWYSQSISSVVPSGSSAIVLRAVNKSDFPIDFHYRETGGSEQAPINILEGRSTADIKLSITSALTFDYYISDGLIDIYIVEYTTGTTSSSTVYCNGAEVASFMGLPTFTASTTPTLAEVNDIIARVCDEIDQFTHHAWRNTTVTDEYYTAMEWTPMIDGLGDWSDRSRIYMMHRKIHSPLTKLECFDGNAWVDFVASYIEGRAKDFWIDYDRGIIHFANRYPLRRRHAVKLSYIYGDNTIPADIKNAAVMLCCYQLLQRDDRSVLLPEGTQNISPFQKSELWYQRSYKLLARRIDIIAYQ